MSAPMAGDARAPVMVDEAPAYDALMGLRAIAQPRTLGRGAWREWAETTAGALSVGQWRRLRAWFGEPMTGSLGVALVALIPLLEGARDLGALADTLAALPLGDVARVFVTSELSAPQTPLDADDLLALRGDRAAARRFCDRYVRVSGRSRTTLAHALAAPEEARAELVATLREHAAGALAALEPRLTAERALAAAELRAQLGRDGGRLPSFIRERDHLEGFAPVVIGVSTLLGESVFLYYHDVDRTLIDGRDYEPFMSVVGARKALGHAPRRRRDASESGEGAADPVARWAALYTALADPSRLQIVRLLVERPRYGQELAAALGMSGATISHHMSALSRAGVLGVERRAHRTYFVLDADALRALLRQGETYLLDTSPHAADSIADIL